MVSKHHIVNPYPGLRSFEPEEAHLFFGRERQIEELIVRLDRTRFLAVVGTSGCGKSSLVRAGLLPTLTEGHPGAVGDSWRTLLFKPGNDPFLNLANAFLGKDEVTGEQSKITTEAQELEKRFRQEERGLLDTIDQLHGRDRNLVIVVDQFEELFTFHTSGAEDLASTDSKEFVERLLVAVRQTEVPVFLVLTMRSDFLGNCTEFTGLTEEINNGQFLIPRMTFEDRKLAIMGPMDVANGNIADRLVDRILQEAGEGQDQLPILQHTLMRMWDYWKSSRIGDQPMDYHEYEAVGGIDKALSLHAEEAYTELDDNRQKRLAEVLLKALTDLGADNRGTRRPTPLKEIAALAEATTEELAEVVEVFRMHGRAFLMPPPKVALEGDTVIDISHESLMRKWGRLNRWVEEEIKSAELYLRLCNSAALYQQGKTGLLGNPELQLAMNWRQETLPNLDWAQRYDLNFERAINFLDHSEREYNLAIAKKENQQKRELKRARRFTVILGLASVVSLLFLLLAFNLKFKAEDSERQARKQATLAETKSRQALEQTKEAIAQKRISEQQQEIASQQRLIAEKNRNVALEQSEIAKKNEAIATQQRGIAQGKEKEAVAARDLANKNAIEAKRQEGIAKVNQQKAEDSEANTQRLRLLAVARNIAITSSNLDQEEEPELVQLLALQAYNFNRDNGGSAHQPDIYNALAHATADEEIFRGHSDAVRCLAFNPKNGSLISGSESGEIFYWSNSDEQKPVQLKSKAKGGSIRSIASSKTGSWMAAGDYLGNLFLWQDGKADAMKKISLGSRMISSLVFHPSEKYVFVGGSDSTIVSIDLSNLGQPPHVVGRMKARLTSLAVSEDAALLASAANDGRWRLYDLRSGKQKSLYQGKIPAGGITSIDFSADNKHVAIASETGKIFIYDVQQPALKPLQLSGHTSPVSDLDFHPTNYALVSSSMDGTAKLWNLSAEGSEPVLLDNLDQWAWTVAYSPNGEHIAVGGQDKSIRRMSSNAASMTEEICPALGRNLSEEEWTKYIGNDIEQESTCPNLPLGSDNANPNKR